jgi:hypothetical protein
MHNIYFTNINNVHIIAAPRMNDHEWHIELNKFPVRYGSTRVEVFPLGQLTDSARAPKS